MCNVQGDCILTYDLQLAEEHSDSSDFEGNSPPVAPKEGNHALIKKKLFTKSKKVVSLEPCSSHAYSANDSSSKEMWQSQTIVSQNGQEIDLEVHQSYQNRQSTILDSGDQIETIKSKRSLIRHKVIPCLSSMFGRSSNNVKQMSIIKENQAENVNIDNSCQAGRLSGEYNTRKFNRKQQCYAMQPVYVMEGKKHAKSSPYQRTKIEQEPLSPQKAVGNENSNINCSLTSSSEIMTRRFLKRKKCKDKYKYYEPEKDIDGSEYYEGPKVKNKEQQYHSKSSRKHLHTQQVYTTPCPYERLNAGCSPIISSSKHSGNAVLPTSCSGFWEYLFNKINMKYQAQAAAGLFKPCKCNVSAVESSRGPTTRETTSQNLSCQITQPCYIPPCPPLRQECSCNTSLPQAGPPNPHESMYQRPSPSVPPPYKTKGQDKIECKCPKQRPQLPSHSTSPKGTPIPMGPVQPNQQNRPCQLTHEEITGVLTQKYNGEILCIHNPPCVLINGCLNLPPPKEELAMDVWPITQDNKTYQQLYSKKCSKRHIPLSPKKHSNQIMDVSCQYCVPFKEKMEPTTINDGSCQYQPSMELKRMLIIDEGCQYQYSPTDIRKQHDTANESCQYRQSPLEIHNQIATTSETCQFTPSPYVIQHQTTKESRHFINPTIEVRQLKAPPKKEQIVQSICNHDPPCEVIRTCCKTKFDPKLQNSCVHVPMCEKVPLCLMELKSKNLTSCLHKPKCAEVPICTRNYIILTAKEEVATQVRPKAKMVCRHEPPCIMIPKCLARICDSYVPYDAIPDCIHQPTCEMIPACCRKSAKEMVSVCSQYPNQCCIM